jgi:hypothetical protein
LVTSQNFHEKLVAEIRGDDEGKGSEEGRPPIRDDVLDDAEVDRLLFILWEG